MMTEITNKPGGRSRSLLMTAVESWGGGGLEEGSGEQEELCCDLP